MQTAEAFRTNNLRRGKRQRQKLYEVRVHVILAQKQRQAIEENDHHADGTDELDQQGFQPERLQEGIAGISQKKQ